MIRTIIICEGETEQEFCKTVLYPHFLNIAIHIQAPLIKKSMGGIVNWFELKKQINMHLKSDKSAYVTLLIDYYGIQEKHEFPNWEEAEKEPNKNRRMSLLENAMVEEIDSTIRNRFIPYIQLHEFEGLLFIDKQIFYDQIPTDELIGITELNNVFANFNNPEMINNNRTNSPSHRLAKIINGYNKIVYGNILAEAIGLSKIRNKCPRFNDRISSLENLKTIS